MTTITIRQSMNARRPLNAGQALVIAIIMLGVLLIIGFAFAGVVSRNIEQASRSTQRTLASDLAQAGVHLAHYQLQTSALGADWRPSVTPPDIVANFSKDPDALWLRPADPALPFPGQALGTRDLGGPDGQGPFTRVFFDRGRALVRVRFAPSEFDLFADPTGQLRQPGKARSYLTIEAVGRPGLLRTGGRIDPSRQLAEQVQVVGFASAAAKADAIGRAKDLDFRIVDSYRQLAFASIGIIESARFITNRDRVSRAAEIGFPTSQDTGGAADRAGIGARYEGQPVNGLLAWGQTFVEPNPGRASNWRSTPGGGSLWANADVVIHGRSDVSLNTFLGEMWAVAGTIRPANSLAQLRVSRTAYDRGTDLWRSNWLANPSTVNAPVVLNAGGLDSGAPGFDTVGGVLRDGASRVDQQAFPRGIARKDPPSIMSVDPQNGLNRYLVLTRDSGVFLSNRNSGNFGYGRGVYVDAAERGNTNSEDEREQFGAVRSLPTDWLSPNNATIANSGWQGPYYVPLASYLELLPDGFVITRDSRGNQRTRFWRQPNGAPALVSSVRFRVRIVGGQAYILNSVQHPTLVNQPGPALPDTAFTQSGLPFNGVVYFEGDVRTRGVIPTHVQMTVVSMGTIYVEGSVTKGVVDEAGNVVSTPSRSMLALLARDYTVVNTTMIFGPAPGENPSAKNADNLPDTPNPVELDLAQSPSLTLTGQFLLDPQTPAGVGGDPRNPSTWLPFANRYAAFGTGTAIDTNLLLTSSADDNGPAFVSIDVQPNVYAGGGTSFQSLLVPRVLTFGAANVVFNAADGFFPPAPSIPVYGLGDPTRNAFPRFETVAVPVVTATWALTARRLGDTTAPSPQGNVQMAVQDPTLFRARLVQAGTNIPKNFLIARSALAPFDVRIEATMFAETGSFYVIPGRWFNTNSADTRDNWQALGATDADRNRRRFDQFGNTPPVPFFGEPLAVRVSIFGAVSENMPAPISQQAAWLRKWGWIPRRLGSTGQFIPAQHVPNGYNLTTDLTVPNLTVTYDPALATASADGATPIRRDADGWTLPPLPRLPVSPTLAYFGEVNP